MLTGVNKRYRIVDRFFSIHLEDLGHIREGGLPLECGTQVTMRTHGTQITAGGLDVSVQGFAYLIS